MTMAKVWLIALVLLDNVLSGTVTMDGTTAVTGFATQFVKELKEGDQILDQGGRGIIQSSIDSGAFSTFVLSDGMIGQSLIDNVDGDLSGSFGTIAGSDSEGAAIFKTVASSNGIPGDGPYEPESYDAAALMILAMQAGNSSDRASIAANIMNVANAPGEIILPGQLAKGLEILSNGGQVNYQGATNVEFTEVGESTGSFKELEIGNGKFNTIKFR